jgi:hypothetical protein
MTLAYRYLDPKQDDQTYLYLPTLRRVLRGDAGTRSTPITNSCISPDDLFGWDGRTFAFSYKFIKEQKVLFCADTNADVEWGMKKFKETGGDIPYDGENWSIRDAYVIEVIPKDNRYPQSRKLLYIDKEVLGVMYSSSWDRAGNLWKGTWGAFRRDKLPDGDTNVGVVGVVALDLQFGMISQYYNNFHKFAGFGITYADLMPSALLLKAR